MKELLEAFELYYHDEYGEGIVSGAIDGFVQLSYNEPDPKWGDAIVDILQRLVQLRDHKDEFGKDSHYMEEQPILWKEARERLENYDVQQAINKKH